MGLIKNLFQKTIEKNSGGCCASNKLVPIEENMQKAPATTAKTAANK